MANKAGLPANEGQTDAEEPGAVDNRLSLNPSDFPVVNDWEDGQTYKLAELGDDVELRQISPGEFEVLPGAAANEAESETEDEGEMPMKKGGMMKGGYKNPAVAKMAEEM